VIDPGGSSRAVAGAEALSWFRGLGRQAGRARRRCYSRIAHQWQPVTHHLGNNPYAACLDRT